MSLPVSLLGSFSGTNAWFVLTNGFFTSNSISVCLITNGSAGDGQMSDGGHQVDPGGAYLFSVDHPELIGHTNNFYGQFCRFGAPSDPNDAATKSYCDGLYANSFNQNYSSSVDGAGVVHFSFTEQNVTLSDIAMRLNLGCIQSFVPGGMTTNGWQYDYNDGLNDWPTLYPTNFLLTIAQTNLSTGWFLQQSTNLSLTAGFTLWTNYTAVTNSGLVTLTIPNTAPVAFFRVVNSISFASSFFVPLGVPEIAYVTNTITHSTNSTYGYGAGLMDCDTNYIYVSVGTNAWRRLAIPTNTW
jgi:hypothetical protein